MGEKRWKRKKVRKTCPDCGVTMTVDPARIRCIDCARKRQRKQVSENNRERGYSRKTSICDDCGESFRQSTKTDHALCSSCRIGAEKCPKCGDPLRGDRKYRACGNCFYVTNTEEALQRVSLKPTAPWIAYDKPWQMECLQCGEVVTPTFANILRKGTGCGVCSGNLVTEKRLKETLDFYDLEPLESWPGSAKPWRCRCKACNRETSVNWASIYAQEHAACRYCSGIRVDETEVRAYMEQQGHVRPLVRYKNAKSRWKSECLRCGSVVYPTYDRVKSGFGACSKCAEYGFRADDPSVLYLLHAAELGAGKIGITNSTGVRKGTVRLRGFVRYGFEVDTLYEFRDGWSAREVERRVLSWIREELSLSAFLTSEQLPNGWTETFDWSAVPTSSLRRRIAGLARSRAGARIP